MRDEQKSAGSSDASKAVDRRARSRYKFTAAVEIVEHQPVTQIEARVGDLSERGCYVETSTPLALGTQGTISITKGTNSFLANVRVVYSSARGMGLEFTTIDATQLRTLESWLKSCIEANWLSSNRRKTQRVMLQVPVLVSGTNRLGSSFEEDTQTLSVNADGGLILLSTAVNKGQRLALLNVATKAALECVIAYIGERKGNRVEVGVAFILPNPRFWHVTFPPKD
jgi:hypothetical protein